MTQKKKRTARALVVLITLLVAVMVAASLPLPAMATSAPLPASGEIEVVSYITDLNKGSGTVYQPDEITPGMEFDLVVTFRDSRLSVVQNGSWYPYARMNTASFGRNRNMGSLMPDAALLSLVAGTIGTDPTTGEAVVTKPTTYQMRFPLKYTGTGNTFTCEISYYTDGNYGTVAPVAMQPVSITLSNCVEKTDTSGSTSDGTSTATRGTGFVLKSASYGDNAILAGSNFNLSATLLSTNGTYNVENVSVEVVPAKEFTITGGSGIYYVGTVKPNQSIPVSFPLTASAVAEEGSYTVTINIKGVNANDGTPAEAAMDISIPILQPERFEMGNVTVPDYLTAGMDDGMGYTTVALINKGKGTVYNVSAEVVGEGLTTDEGNQFIGNIASGTESSADFNIHASVPGEIKAQIVVTYENSRGEIKTLTHDFTVTVGEGGDMIIDPFPVEPMPEEGGGGVPGWVWLLAGLAVVAGGVITAVILVKKHKAKKEAALDDEDSYEDL